MNKSEIKTIFWPIPRLFSDWKAVLLPFILSPVVLSVFYWTLYFLRSPAIQQRGLYQFFSVTGGDFILLPFSWYVIARYYLNIREFKSPPTAIWLGILLGFAGTLAITLSGINGPDRDWTIPEPGMINFAGIYHSLFMAFMMANYYTFMIDHWVLMFRKTGKETAGPVRAKLMTAYWWILDLVSIFLVLLWNDRLYFRRDLSFFQADPVQQIGWLGFLATNAVLTIALRIYPFHNARKWLLKQTITWAAILATGILISLR